MRRWIARFKEGLMYFCGHCGKFMPISHFPH